MSTGASGSEGVQHIKRRAETVGRLREMFRSTCVMWVDETMNSQYSITYGQSTVLRPVELKALEKDLRSKFGEKLHIFIKASARKAGAGGRLTQQDITLEAFRRDDRRSQGQRPRGRLKH